MDDAKFWSLLEPGRLDEDPKNRLRGALMKLEPEELVVFQARFDEAFARANRPELVAAAGIIAGSTSPETFAALRYALILRGKAVFEAALRDADSLAYVAIRADPDAGYLAFDAYEAKTGAELPHAEGPPPPEPLADAAKRLPKLSAKYK